MDAQNYSVLIIELCSMQFERLENMREIIAKCLHQVQFRATRLFVIRCETRDYGHSCAAIVDIHRTLSKTDLRRPERCSTQSCLSIVPPLSVGSASMWSLRTPQFQFSLSPRWCMSRACVAMYSTAISTRWWMFRNSRKKPSRGGRWCSSQPDACRDMIALWY